MIECNNFLKWKRTQQMLKGKCCNLKFAALYRNIDTQTSLRIFEACGNDFFLLKHDFGVSMKYFKILFMNSRIGVEFYVDMKFDFFIFLVELLFYN